MIDRQQSISIECCRRETSVQYVQEQCCSIHFMIDACHVNHRIQAKQAMYFTCILNRTYVQHVSTANYVYSRSN
jgi:hypothetical protein